MGEPAARPPPPGSRSGSGSVPRRAGASEVGLLADAAPPAGDAAALLSSLAPAHLRVDAHAGGAPYAPRGLAEAIGARLELAVTADPGDPAGLAAWLGASRVRELPLARLLVYGSGTDVTPAALAAAARPLLAPGVALGGGSDGHFADLNRTRPALEQLDVLAFPMTPQVHGFDADTIVEALEGQAAVLGTAAAIWPRLPVVISPLTLRPRRGPGSEPRAGAPAGTDPRQATLFGAAWSLAAPRC